MNTFIVTVIGLAVAVALLLILRQSRLSRDASERAQRDNSEKAAAEAHISVTHTASADVIDAQPENIVAAISAVLSVVTGGQPLVIKSIRRSASREAGKASAWAQAGRQEQIYSRIN